MKKKKPILVPLTENMIDTIEHALAICDSDYSSQENRISGEIYDYPYRKKQRAENERVRKRLMEATNKGRK